MPRPSPSDCPFVLIVEGQDDDHVIWQIAKQLGLDKKFVILAKEGYPDVLAAMGPEVKIEGRKAVGFVLDADAPARERWEEVSLALADLRAVPEHPDPQGTILPGAPRIGVWLMPNNGSDGELEDFVATMVRPNDAVWPLANAYLRQLPDAAREHVETKPQKAAVHVWLANKKKPGRMGAAIGAGHLDTESELASRLSSWLRRLFDDETS